MDNSCMWVINRSKFFTSSLDVPPNKTMFNSEHEGFYASSPHMGPRISFSHDFVDTQQQAAAIKHEVSYKEAPVPSDFQFSVRDHSMISADEIFSKGKMLPLKNKRNDKSLKKTTLRDELLVEDDSDDLSPEFGTTPGRWRDRWSLKRSSFGSKRGDKSESCLERVLEEKASIFTLTNKKKQVEEQKGSIRVD